MLRTLATMCTVIDYVDAMAIHPINRLEEIWVTSIRLTMTVPWQLREPYKGMYQDGLNSASRFTSCRVRTSGSCSSLLRSALWRNVTLLLFTGAERRSRYALARTHADARSHRQGQAHPPHCPCLRKAADSPVAECQPPAEKHPLRPAGLRALVGGKRSHRHALHALARLR